MIDTELDPSRPYQLLIAGKKGWGKSEHAAWYYSAYPFDRLVLDNTGDVAAGPLGHEPGVVILRGDDGDDIPGRWPEPAWGQTRTSVIYVPDPTSPSYQDQMDRLLGLAFRKGRTLVWIEETHEVMKAGQTKSHSRRMLRQGRHRGIFLVLCDPRVIDLDLLTLHNADEVVVYRLPQRADRQRIIDALGLEEDLASGFYDAAARLPRFEHLRIDTNTENEEDRVVWMDPLPVREPRARAAAGVGT